MLFSVLLLFVISFQAVLTDYVTGKAADDFSEQIGPVLSALTAGRDAAEGKLTADTARIHSIPKDTTSTSRQNDNEDHLIGTSKPSCHLGVPNNLLENNISEKYASSCNDIRNNGNFISGIYYILPEGFEKPIMVLCDMETRGGGWTHIQKRFDGSQDFYLDWRDYKFGFGNLNGEFWLGLENIYKLTGLRNRELLVEIVDRNNVTAYAHYTSFGIGSEQKGYPLTTLNGFSGDAGDSLSHHIGMKFSTKDLDQDKKSGGSCAMDHKGGWWYRSCHTSNLNGKFLNTEVPDSYKYETMDWVTFRGALYVHSKARMMIR